MNPIAAHKIAKDGTPQFAIFTTISITSIASASAGAATEIVFYAEFPHGISVGDSVTISGASNANLNVTTTVSAINTVTNSITVPITYASVSGSTGGIVKQRYQNGVMLSASVGGLTPHQSWSPPSRELFATYCGGGNGGAGGYNTVTGGGGGGGGASCTFRDLPVLIGRTASPLLNITIGLGGTGGAIATAGGFGGITKIESAGTNDILYPLPTGRPDRTTAGKAQPGTATDGGAGGHGAPMFTTIKASPATGESPYGGPAGGAGGTGITPGQPGYSAIRRGVYGTTGGAGGGGGSTNAASYGGSGGADDKHGDSVSSEGASGGAGGGSAFGGGAYGGDSSNARSPNGENCNGYGGGGGGGAGLSNIGGAAGTGGRGGDGIVIFKYFT